MGPEAVKKEKSCWGGNRCRNSPRVFDGLQTRFVLRSSHPTLAFGWKFSLWFSTPDPELLLFRIFLFFVSYSGSPRGPHALDCAAKEQIGVSAMLLLLPPLRIEPSPLARAPSPQTAWTQETRIDRTKTTTSAKTKKFFHNRKTLAAMLKIVVIKPGD
jgi:hypothetical protein